MPHSSGRRPQSRPPGRPRPASRQLDLPREVVDELRHVAKRGRGDEALSILTRAVDHLSRGDSGRAAAEAEQAKKLAPRSAAVREVLGLAHYGQGRFREALSEMQAYRRMSGRADQNHIVADCYRALGQPEKAVDLAEEAVRAKIPDEARAEAAVVGASALADLGRIEQALALLARLPTRPDVGRPFDLRVWYVTGDILERAGRRSEAAKEFRRVLRYDPAAFDAAERLAQLG